MSLHRPNLWRALIGLLLFVACIAIAMPVEEYAYDQHLASVATTTAGLPHYGIAAGSSLTDMSPSQLDAYFASIQQLGAGWVRFDFDWNQIQPNGPRNYDWSTYDSIVQAATAHHLDVIGIIDFTPTWARPADCQDAEQCAPANPATYASFAKTIAARYMGKVNVWEIWNEPNTQTFWQPAPNPQAYAAMLKAAYISIHEANKNAIVLTGSTAPASTTSTSVSPADFLTDLYRAGDRPYFDAVGDHPYTYPLMPNASADQAWAQMSQGSDSLRSIMVRHGDSSKKIWITEYGAPTGGPGPAAGLNGSGLDQQPWHVTAALQAAMLQEAFTLYRSYNWVGPMLIYSYQDAGTANSTNENFFGLVTTSGTAKPALAVVRYAFAQQ